MMAATDIVSRLRFPVLFIGILGFLITGFAYRKNFMQDLEGMKASLEQENQEAKRMLESTKLMARKRVKENEK